MRLRMNFSQNDYAHLSLRIWMNVIIGKIRDINYKVIYRLFIFSNYRIHQKNLIDIKIILNNWFFCKNAKLFRNLIYQL